MVESPSGMYFCHECGAKIAPDDPFCGNCGVAQPADARSREEAGELKEGALSAAAAGDSSTPLPASQLDITQSPDRPTPSEQLNETQSPNPQSLLDTTESPDAAPQARAGASEMAATIPPEASRDTGEARRSPDDVQHTQRAGSGGSRRGASKQLEPGFLLNGRYEIVRRIGGGGMGAVYLAKDQHLGDAPRAVKEMVESHIDDAQHEKAINDFKRESLLLTELEHPSIPTVYDYFYDDNSERFYLVMKFIPGADLASRLRATPQGRIDEPTVTEWGIQVADVLHYLHTRPQPIIYRDLKPANLMIDSNNNRIMLIDFGIARWVNKKEKGVTAVGTMGYAPPELFSGRADPRVDIYSLGATLFHLLTGSDPQDNPLLIFDFTKNPRPRQINPQLSSEIERLLIRAVEYKPEHRFQSGAEMRDALSAHLDKLRSGQVS